MTTFAAKCVWLRCFRMRTFCVNAKLWLNFMGVLMSIQWFFSIDSPKSIEVEWFYFVFCSPSLSLKERDFIYGVLFNNQKHNKFHYELLSWLTILLLPSNTISQFTVYGCYSLLTLNCLRYRQGELKWIWSVNELSHWEVEQWFKRWMWSTPANNWLWFLSI